MDPQIINKMVALEDSLQNLQTLGESTQKTLAEQDEKINHLTSITENMLDMMLLLKTELAQINHAQSAVIQSAKQNYPTGSQKKNAPKKPEGNIDAFPKSAKGWIEKLLKEDISQLVALMEDEPVHEQLVELVGDGDIDPSKYPQIFKLVWDYIVSSQECKVKIMEKFTETYNEYVKNKSSE